MSIGGPAGLKFYRYDVLGRLNRIEGDVRVIKNSSLYISGWQQSYQYDRFGNRTTISTGANSPVPPDGWTSLSYDPATNRITTAGFSYDPAGNQLLNNTGQAFVYDAAGRLTKVKNLSGATLATYTYGASNRRLITQTGNESSTDKTYYIWEGNSVIAEYVEQTTATMPKWSKNCIYLGGRLLATEAPNGAGEIVHYHHLDRLGTKLVTNNLDTTSFYQTNLPFGTALVAESTSGITSVTNRRFTSYDRSATTGLDYAINRQYDSRQGRFTQVDPLGMAASSLADPQSLNMYSYVGNDPVNRVDPDGQFWGALFKFIAGLFTNLKPNVINGSFTYKNVPPISVASTPNFQNIGVGFAGIGFAVRSNGHWLPAILGSRGSLDDPQDGETEPLIRFLPAVGSYDSNDEKLLREILDSLAESSGCEEAFKRAGLEPITALIPHGIVIGPATLLLNSSNLAMMGITDFARRRDLDAVGSTYAQAFTIRNHKGFKPDTTDTRPRIFLNASAFGGGKLTLREVLAHEFLHVAGVQGYPSTVFGRLLGRDDLTYYKYYEDVLNACK